MTICKFTKKPCDYCVMKCPYKNLVQNDRKEGQANGK